MRIISDASGTWADNMVVSAGGGAPLHTWSHIAWVRNGNSMTIYKNGTSVATMSGVSAYNFYSPAHNLGFIGFFWDGGTTRYFNGYISNLRVVKGTALYTTTFTPSTTPLTAIANTSLLTCQSNRFKDNSTNNFTITRYVAPKIQRFSPFSPNDVYSANTIGGSGYFDGSGDSLSVPNNSVFNFGTGDFTVEFWLYCVSTWSSMTNPGIAGQKTGDGTNGWVIYRNGGSNTDKINVRLSSGDYHSSVAPSTNTWEHWALVRNGTTLTWYKDGVAAGSYAGVSANITDSGIFYSGYTQTWGGYFGIGYISNLRIIKATAVYTGNFTPPTAPLATTGSTSAASYPSTANVNTTFAAANTSILCNFTNAGIVDSAMQNNLETVADTKISTTQSKFGGTSMFFDGTGDYLILPAGQTGAFNTGDFTIEFWFYATTVATAYQAFIAQRTGDTVAAIGWSIRLGTSTFAADISNGSTNYTLTHQTAVSANSWNHGVLVRSGTSITLYLNGVANSSPQTVASNYTLNGSGATIYVGYASSGSVISPFAGYIDDLRITKGYARYTATFTPPTRTLPGS
jgi:hypothetical protein